MHVRVDAYQHWIYGKKRRGTQAMPKHRQTITSVFATIESCAVWRFSVPGISRSHIVWKCVKWFSGEYYIPIRVRRRVSNWILLQWWLRRHWHNQINIQLRLLNHSGELLMQLSMDSESKLPGSCSLLSDTFQYNTHRLSLFQLADWMNICWRLKGMNEQ